MNILKDYILETIDNRGRNPIYQNKGKYPVIDNVLIKNFIYPDMNGITRYIDEDTYNNFLRGYLCKNMPIMTLVGNGIGNVSLAPSENVAIVQNTIGFKVKDNIDEIFLYYYLLYNQERIKNFDRGSGQPSIKKTDILRMEVEIPNIETQRKISGILFSIDEKILLNNKINTNLEAQAQALFKHWFIDFAPFKDGNCCANREQNETCFNSAEVQPKITGKPCKFVESELGLIPEGWRVASLSSIADYVNGLAMQKFRPEKGEEGLYVLKIKELGQGGFDANSELCSPSKIGDKYTINDGDIIFSWSGTLMVKIWCGGKCGLNQHLFNVVPNDYPKWFVYLWTKHHLDKFIRIAKDKAVTMGHIKRGELDKAMVVVPSDEDLNKIDALMAPIHQQIVNSELESRRLAELRDTLLPKLMSGQINVNDIKI